MKRRIADFNLENVNEFIKQTVLSSRKQYFSEEAWAKLVAIRNQAAQDFSILWQTRVDLFRDVELKL